MTYVGRVTKSGTICLMGAITLPEGTIVRVQPMKGKRRTDARSTRNSNLYRRMKSFIGKAKNLPTDLAEHHDHYLYGQAKR